MMEVYLGSEFMDADYGKDTIDRPLRRKLISEGYSIETKTDYKFRIVKFFAVKH